MQSFIGLTELFEGRFEEGLVLDSLSRTQGRQAVEAHIDANSSRFLHRNLIRDFDLDTHEPPIRYFGDPCPSDRALKSEILCHIDPAELGNPEAMISQRELIVGQIEAWFAALFALELRAACLAFKKGGKGFAQVQKRLIRGVLGDLPGSGELLAPDLVEVLRCRFKAVGFSPA